MGRSRVTEKFQVTIPKEVREITGVRAGEIVTVEAVSEGEIRLKRFVKVKEPLRVLIGPHGSRHIPVDEIEEAAEAR